METNYQTNDVLRDEIPAETPKALKTLTTLTFIGCGLGYLGALAATFTTKPYATMHADMEKQLEKAGSSGMARRMLESSLESLEKNPSLYDRMYDYRYVLMATGLLFTTLCLIGAMRMRKLRRSGFPIYTVGELAPILVSGILIGFGGDGTWKTILGYLIPVIFVALYAGQRKHLIND
jgi:hypothetical protein